MADICSFSLHTSAGPRLASRPRQTWAISCLASSGLGAKGVGEIGNVGIAAAIANAVFNATGVRVRDLPILPEKLLAGLPL